jgi:hypothetical protein
VQLPGFAECRADLVIDPSATGRHEFLALAFDLILKSADIPLAGQLELLLLQLTEDVVSIEPDNLPGQHLVQPSLDDGTRVRGRAVQDQLIEVFGESSVICIGGRGSSRRDVDVVWRLGLRCRYVPRADGRSNSHGNGRDSGECSEIERH